MGKSAKRAAVVGLAVGIVLAFASCVFAQDSGAGAANQAIRQAFGAAPASGQHPSDGQALTYDATTKTIKWTTLPASSFGSQSGNVVLASPANGSSASPAFRTLVAADVPSLPASQITSGQLAVAQGGTGAATGAQNLVFGTPNGSSGAPSFRTLVSGDLPAAVKGWNYSSPLITLATSTDRVEIGSSLSSSAKFSAAGDGTHGRILLQPGGSSDVEIVNAASNTWFDLFDSGNISIQAPNGFAFTGQPVSFNVGNVNAVQIDSSGNVDLSAATSFKIPPSLVTSAATDGQVLIGQTSDHTLGLATLTAGSNVTITNAGHSITIAASGASSLQAAYNGGATISESSGSPISFTNNTTGNNDSALVIGRSPSSPTTAHALSISVGNLNSSAIHLTDGSSAVDIYPHILSINGSRGDVLGGPLLNLWGGGSASGGSISGTNNSMTLGENQTITSGSATTIGTITLATDAAATLRFEVSLQATDTSGHVAQTHSYLVTANVVSQNGTVTASFVADDKGTQGTGTSSAVFSLSGSNIQITPTLSGITPTSFKANYLVLNISGATLALP